MTFKQYGAVRTGTNVLRRLVTANFEGAQVLMHVLGDKHSAPVDLGRLRAEVRDLDDPAWEFVSRATWRVPATATDPTSATQRAYMRSIAARVFDAEVTERMGFLLSVKDPYAWVASLIVYRGWYRRRYRTIAPTLFARLLRPTLERRLRAACGDFNVAMAAWLALRDRFPSRTAVVRAEDLATSPGAVLQTLREQFDLAWRRPEPQPISGSVAPALWDDEEMREETPDVGRRRQMDKSSIQPMADLIDRVVAEEIDWRTMETLGYSRPYGGRRKGRNAR